MLRDELSDRRIGLADCNNFFCSCERRICPELEGRPVVVLSGNDGCIISRSNEVKAMGVQMGAPFFKYRELLAYHGVAIRSANHRIYQGISSEVMAVIRSYTDCQEIYSIDESFFNLAIPTISDPFAYCEKLRQEIWRRCRIPISIGIAPTKTLAKLGTEYAKKHRETNGVLWMDKSRYKNAGFMSGFPCRDVWGIGPKMAESLSRAGINNAAQFTAREDTWIKDKYNMPGLYTAWELRGFSVNHVQNKRRPQQSIMVSRSFGEPITTFSGVLDALISFTVSAAAQMRRAGLSAGKMEVYVATNRFGNDYYAMGKDFVFHEPETLDGAFIKIATELLKQIYTEGRQYKKCGVILSNLSNVSFGRQTNLFADGACDRRRAAMTVIDRLNNEGNRPVLKPAVLCERPDSEKNWKSKSEFKTDEKALQNWPVEATRFQSHAEDF